MRRKAATSGALGGLATVALFLTGAPLWLVIVGVVLVELVLYRYYILDALENERKRRSGGS